MRVYETKKRNLDAVAYFDRMSSSGQLAGFAALAVVKTAAKFGLETGELREIISIVRSNEKAEGGGPLRAALQRLTTGDYGRTMIEPDDLPEMSEGGVPSPTKDR